MIAPAGVVEFEGVACGAVDERRVERRHGGALTPERRGAAAFAFGAKRFGQETGFLRNGAGDACTDGIEDVAHGLFHHGVGDGADGGFDDEAGKRLAFDDGIGHGFLSENIDAGMSAGVVRSYLLIRGRSRSGSRRPRPK